VTVSNVVVLGSNTRETNSVAVVLFVIQFFGILQQTHSLVQLLLIIDVLNFSQTSRSMV
jgi:hypothetical protein